MESTGILKKVSLFTSTLLMLLIMGITAYAGTDEKIFFGYAVDEDMEAIEETVSAAVVLDYEDDVMVIGNPVAFSAEGSQYVVQNIYEKTLYGISHVTDIGDIMCAVFTDEVPSASQMTSAGYAYKGQTVSAVYFDVDSWDLVTFPVRLVSAEDSEEDNITILGCELLDEEDDPSGRRGLFPFFFFDEEGALVAFMGEDMRIIQALDDADSFYSRGQDESPEEEEDNGETKEDGDAEDSGETIEKDPEQDEIKAGTVKEDDDSGMPEGPDTDKGVTEDEKNGTGPREEESAVSGDMSGEEEPEDFPNVPQVNNNRKNTNTDTSSGERSAGSRNADRNEIPLTAAVLAILIAAAACAAGGVIIYTGRKKKADKDKENKAPRSYGTAAAPEYNVIGTEGSLAGFRFMMTDTGLTFGRDPSCQVILGGNEAGISRIHCRLYPDGRGGLLLMDMGSTYGTYLENGERLAQGQAVPVARGSSFYLGSEKVGFTVR